MIRNIYSSFERWRSISNSIRRARSIFFTLQKGRPNPVVDRKQMREIKRYCRDKFDEEKYWPWLALYTELRGEFVEGWLPDIIYSEHLLPHWNPKELAWISTKKSFDHSLFNTFAISPLARVVNGICYNSQETPISYSCMKKSLAEYEGEIVVKQDSTGSGEGIEFLHGHEIDSYKFDTDCSYVIQPSVEQHPALAEIHGNSICSLRITTFITKMGEIHVKHRTLRFGAGKNRISNKSNLFLFLDKDGQAGTEAFDEIGISNGEKHPESGYVYHNLKVPSIHRAVEACIKAHHQFPYLRFIAWDLYIDPEGTPQMIEWNAVRPDMWVNEALIGPLWSNEEIDEILLHKNK